MHAIIHLDLHAARSAELQESARRHALGRPHRRRRARERVAVVPEGVRFAVGFRLVEAGLRLIVGDGAHPPSADAEADVQLAHR